ncbi:homocysteine S-methyltransferase family protein [Christensenellaceae bacterium OttesenSCG-928-M15]|nr:homocysteine S-methyltransferase family protein [Christensenellaceae bacterium OttesenSCG-928-M15]
MNILDVLGKEILFFDGAMGTMLHQHGIKPGENPDVWSVTHPKTVRDIHKAYLTSGADILTTNTFGCTDKKLEGTGYTAKEVAIAAVQRAKEAIQEEKKTDCFIALDIGPTGKLLEPLGDLGFEEAVATFSQTIQAGAKAGADLVLIETMSDSHELKAAVLAAKETCNLPVFATVVLDKNGKLLTGGDVYSVVAMLEGLHVDALGLNCSLGPKEMLPWAKELIKVASLPVVITPNAGLPRKQGEETVFDVGPELFTQYMEQIAHEGAHVLGGCCGTTPAHIKAMTRRLKGITPKPVIDKNRTVVSSFSKTVSFEGKTVLIGERINPTGKPKLKQALKDQDYDYVMREGIGQQDKGAHVLDVNAGLPGIDESETLFMMVKQLQSVIDLPLQLDSADGKALEKAMRHYNGKPMVNSVNGKQESMDTVFPLVKKYGGLVVALTLDEEGIPETAAGRLHIAKKIIDCAQTYGIQKKDIIVDALTMTVSAGQENAKITLETLRLLKKELDVNTILGVSNVSFGLPERESINAGFLTMAMVAGLDGAIINPHANSMMDAYYSAQVILGKDPQCGEYIRHKERIVAPKKAEEKTAENLTLLEAVKKGLKQQAGMLALQELTQYAPLEVIENSLIPALNDVGNAFEKGTLFLPQLLMSAEAAKAAFDEVKKAMGESGGQSHGTVVIATVEGDVHDIGKNIVKALLENYQFRVIDLGKDVKPERVLEAVKTHDDVKLVGLSALMTTTVDNMKKTITLLRKEGPPVKVMAGGAVLTEEYALSIGADWYAKDAMASIHYAQSVYQV